MVFAIVFNERIAANGLSVSCLYFLNKTALLCPSSSRIVMYESGVDKRTDSSMEHRNDVHRAISKYVNNNPILNENIAQT